MDGNLHPVHRHKHKFIFFDLYITSLFIFAVELAYFVALTLFRILLIVSFYENGGYTTEQLYEQMTNKGIHDTSPSIQTVYKVSYVVVSVCLLVGYISCMIFSIFLCLGTCLLFSPFLKLWWISGVFSSVYVVVGVFLNYALLSDTFPYHVFYYIFRLYFIYAIICFIHQIKEEEENEFDLRSYGASLVDKDKMRQAFQKKFYNEDPNCCIKLYYSVCCVHYRPNLIVPKVSEPDARTVINNMFRDIEEQDLNSLTIGPHHHPLINNNNKERKEDIK